MLGARRRSQASATCIGVASRRCAASERIIRHNLHGLCENTNSDGTGRSACLYGRGRARGFRDAARASGKSASGLSEAIRRLEATLGVRPFYRTTRSVAPTEAGKRLLERLGSALSEVESALDVVSGFRDKPAGTLRLNVPVSAARSSSRGGNASRARFSTTPDGISCLRLCERSSISSELRGCRIRREPRSAGTPVHPATVRSLAS